jgi:hypothetical protein
MLYTCVLWHRMIFWKYEENLILMLCAQYKFLIFGSLDSYDSKLQYLSSLYINQHSAADTMQLPYFQLVFLSQISCLWFIQNLPAYFKPHILATFKAIAMTKLFYRNLCVGSKYKEFPSHEWSAFGSDWKKGCSFG